MKPSKYNLVIETDEKNEYAAYNTLTGALAIVDKELADVLGSPVLDDPSASREDPIPALRQVGFFVENDTDETRIYEVQYNTRKYSMQELWFTLMTTYACNLGCTYCYQGAGALPPARMTNEDARAIIEFIKGYARESGAKKLAVLLCGGEPLLNFRVGLNIIDRLHSWAGEEGVEFGTGLVTNGTLYDRNVAGKMVKYPQRVSQITLDGPREIHNSRRSYRDGRASYDDIIRALEICTEVGIDNLLLRIDVDKDNVRHMQDLFDDLKQRGLNHIPLGFGPIQPKTDACRSYAHRCICGDEARDLLVPVWELAIDQGFNVPLRPHPMFVYCGAQTNFSFMIDPHRNLHKCSNFVGRDKHRVASIKPDGTLTDIRFEYYDWMSRNPMTMQRCRECEVLPLCGGGCAGMAHTRYLTFHHEYCPEIKYLIKNQIRLYLKQKRRERPVDAVSKIKLFEAPRHDHVPF